MKKEFSMPSISVKCFEVNRIMTASGTNEAAVTSTLNTRMSENNGDANNIVSYKLVW